MLCSDSTIGGGSRNTARGRYVIALITAAPSSSSLTFFTSCLSVLWILLSESMSFIGGGGQNVVGGKFVSSSVAV